MLRSGCVYLIRLRFYSVVPSTFFAIPIYRNGGFDFRFHRGGILLLRSFYMLQQKAKLQFEIDSVFNRMPVEDSLLLSNSAKNLNRINLQLRSLDGEMIQEERNLFNI